MERRVNLLMGWWLAAIAAAVFLVLMLRVGNRRSQPGRGARKMSIGIDAMAALKRALRGRSASDPANPELAAPVAADLDSLGPLIKDARVPAVCREKAAKVTAHIDAVIARLGDTFAIDERAIELDRLRTIHLPRLLQRYVDIPPEHRAEIFRRTEKSASYHLAAALDVLSRRVADISLDLASGPLDDFTTGARFVENRYGRFEDPFA